MAGKNRKLGRPRIFKETPPTLPPDLVGTYLLLDDKSKRLFNKAFRRLWRQVFGYDELMRRKGLGLTYWIIEAQRIKYNVAPGLLAALSFLYYIRSLGEPIIHTNTFKELPAFPRSESTRRMILTKLMKAGYINRYYKHPNRPYMRGFNTPVFLEISDKGLKFIESIEKDMFNTLLNTSYKDLTTIKKAPDNVRALLIPKDTTN